MVIRARFARRRDKSSSRDSARLSAHSIYEPEQMVSTALTWLNDFARCWPCFFFISIDHAHAHTRMASNVRTRGFMP